VLVGGHAAYNPEPLAPFIDAAVMGDGEEVTLEVDDAVRRWKLEAFATVPAQDRPQRAAAALAEVEGVYVPAFYEARYHADGRLKQTVPSSRGSRRSCPSAPCRTSRSGSTRASSSCR
jgi:radical SAM superfamily enzyme YgiQ (UPF0313 family)